MSLLSLETVHSTRNREVAMEAQKTPLYDEHLKLGAKMADFAGWMMPLWYPTGQSEEHHATRKACGLFDICHMGEFDIRGKDSLSFLSWMLTNDVERIVDGQAMYNFMLNEDGGVVDDCIVYRFDEKRWMLVVNASDIAGDFNWLKQHAPGGVDLKNISDTTVKIDLQGPNAPKLMAKWMSEETLSGLKFFRFMDDVDVEGMKVLVSRTGYTGEIGFELYTDLGNGVDLWQLLLQEGKPFGILPCGLGARDTLRTEAGLPLHGHELRPDRTAVGHPWEFAISWESEFLGKKRLMMQREKGIDYYVLPFVMEGRRKAMPGWEVHHGGDRVGKVLSGVISPSLENQPIGFVGVDRMLEPETALGFRQVGRPMVLEGQVTGIPFVPLTSRKKMARFL
jgi:aminomethyltransferase